MSRGGNVSLIGRVSNHSSPWHHEAIGHLLGSVADFPSPGKQGKTTGQPFTIARDPHTNLPRVFDYHPHRMHPDDAAVWQAAKNEYDAAVAKPKHDIEIIGPSKL